MPGFSPRSAAFDNGVGPSGPKDLETHHWTFAQSRPAMLA
jgi:hypothetical protein